MIYKIWKEVLKDMCDCTPDKFGMCACDKGCSCDKCMAKEVKAEYLRRCENK